MNNKILIVYFSHKGENYVNGKIKNLNVGNTEIVAKKIQSIVGGDLFEIVCEKPYPQNYKECTEQAQNELRQNIRPKIVGNILDISKYEVVYIGYPNWWSTMPMPVFTFLESYDFSNKIIRPFCTHEGSKMGKSESDIKVLCPDSIVFKGLPIWGSKVSQDDKELYEWITSSI